MDRLIEIMTILLPILFGVVATTFGFFFKNLINGMRTSIEDLSNSIKELIDSGQKHEITDNVHERSIVQANKERSLIFEKLEKHDLRIGTLESFRDKITSIHNNIHSDNKL